MTLPFERSNALRAAREFMRALLDPKQTPKVPLDVRRRARACLKHFPGELEIEQAAKEAPSVFGKYAR